MGTIVTIATVGDAGDAVTRAFDWFRQVEARCSRFDLSSELSLISAAPGKAIPVSDLVFEALRFALHVAEVSGGAFDPVVGGAMAARGFNRHYLTGDRLLPRTDLQADATFRDVALDARDKTVTLQRPLTLDLGGLAKGLAIDLAARELAPVRDFSIDAGGDLFLGGQNDEGQDWTVGIRHPRKDHTVIEVVHVSDQAVCTSGDYERGRHLLTPGSGTPATSVASATVIAPTAMLADAASTAAFVLGPADGVAFCRRIGVRAILFTPDLERHEAIL
ncbi:MAG: FAD:protein FMN transferase [Acidobacteria bacterium]|nr:MAG: FAD:protein FMN transferase [Acidobacteriota bacterium]